MSIPVTCDCGRQLEVKEHTASCTMLVCPDCGRELAVPKPPTFGEELFAPWESPSPRTSGKAITSLTLGVLFFFTCLTGLPAILFGRQALRDIESSKGRLRGRRMAITGIVFGVIGCLFT